MKVVVFGAGALGSLIGGLLSRRHEVILVGRQPHVQAIEESGLVISGMVEAVFVVKAVEDLRSIADAEMVIITVKAYDSAMALDTIAPLVKEGTIVLSLQNGLKHASLLKERYPRNEVVGVTSMGATKVGHGRVYYAGVGDTIFGSLSGNERMAEKAAEVFDSVGMDSVVTSEIVTEIWLKAIINASINPITAIAKCKNGRVLQDENLRAVSEMACREAALVSEAAGVDLHGEEPFERVREVLKRTADNKSSMLQDVEKKRRTEIDEINGEIIRRGEEKGVDVPVNRTLWHLTKALTEYGR